MPVGQPLTAVWRFDSAGADYVDNTIEAQSAGGTAFALLSVSGDYCYFGFSRRFDALMWAQSAAGSYGALTWEYGATASSWLTFVPTRDGGFSSTKEYMRWDPRGSTIDTAWAAFAITTSTPDTASSVPDSTERFWIRVSAASVTTVATMNHVVCRPYVTYATPVDVQKQLQLSTPFSSSSTPDLFTIEDFIRGAEDQLIYQSGHSWRTEFIEDELINFNQYGMKLRREDVQDIYELAVWDGSNFDAKVEGRDQDFHVESTTGMIYVATIFLDAIPPNFRRSYSSRRDQGAFKRAVRVNYSWGLDFRKDQFSVQVGRIAVKQACIDMVTDLDFAPLIPLGLDVVTLQQKVDNWTKDVQDFLATYSKLRLY